MDVTAIRKKYGRNLRLWGGVDKRALTKGKAEIDAEIARHKWLIEDGGFVPMLDHSAPPDVPYENCCYFMEQCSVVSIRSRAVIVSRGSFLMRSSFGANR